MNQHPQPGSLWTRFVNWLLGLFRGSSSTGTGDRAGQHGASSSSAETSDTEPVVSQSGGAGSRLADTASGLRDTADAAIDRGGQAWDHLLGNDEQTGASGVTSDADIATGDAAGSAKGEVSDAAAGASAATSGAGSSSSGSTAASSAGTTGAGTDSLLGEPSGMGESPSSTAASAVNDASSSTGTTGIEREAAERARHRESSPETSSSATAATTGQAMGQAGQPAPVDQSAQLRSEETAGGEGDESDRLTLLAEPPVAGDDVVISSTSVTGFIPGETSDTTDGESAGGARGERVDQPATGTGSSESGAYAEAEVGLADAGTKSGPSSPTPGGADAEFVAGTDIDWTSAAEWEELEEEAEMSAPAGGGQPTGSSSTSATAGPAPSTGTRDTAGQSAGSSASGRDAATTGQARASDHADEGGRGTQQGAGVGSTSGEPTATATATASDQATVPFGAIPGDGSRECPSDHPIKGNANSMIYHMPGQSSYDGTAPEFCFANEDDAMAAGYRASKARGRTDTGDEHDHQAHDSGHGREDHAPGSAGSATTGIAASGASGPMTSGERTTSLESDADVSTTPPAAVTSRPGTNQPMGLTRDQGQSASGSATGGSAQTASSLQSPGTASSAAQSAGPSTPTEGRTQQSAASSAPSRGQPSGTEPAGEGRGSTRADGSHNCPDGYPIKGNQSSMIYHMPHQSSYQGTKAEICFATEEDAIAAGYRRRRDGSESGSDAHGHHAGSAHDRHSGDRGGSSTAMTGASGSGTAATQGSGSRSQTGQDQTGSTSAPPSDGHEAVGLRDQSQSTSTAGSNTPSGSMAGDGTRDCPEGYPIKGNASSRIYHMPGQSAYDVTEAEFCFATEEAATAAGYRAAKR